MHIVYVNIMNCANIVCQIIGTVVGSVHISDLCICIAICADRNNKIVIAAAYCNLKLCQIISFIQSKDCTFFRFKAFCLGIPPSRCIAVVCFCNIARCLPITCKRTADYDSLNFFLFIRGGIVRFLRYTGEHPGCIYPLGAVFANLNFNNIQITVIGCCATVEAQLNVLDISKIQTI